ncbi:MAG: hypothetical protein AB8D78_00745 [Akkermansiaceae bacterium]
MKSPVSIVVLVCLPIALALVGSLYAEEGKEIQRCGVVPAKRELADLQKTKLEVRGNGAEVKWNRGLQISFSEVGGSARIVMPKPGFDVNDSVVIEVEIENLTDTDVTILGQMNNNRSSRGFLNLPPSGGDVLVLHLMRLATDGRKKDGVAKSPFPGMLGSPGGRMVHWDAENRNHRCRSIVISDLDGRSLEKEIRIKRVMAKGKFGEIPSPGLEEFFPFVDEFGQYKHGAWPGKKRTKKDLLESKKVEVSDLGVHSSRVSWSKYGGWKEGPKLDATGHFRTQKHGGKWWLVDPEGYLFWSHGVTGVGVGSKTRVKWRKRFFESLPSAHIEGDEIDFLAVNLEHKYGSDWKKEHRSVSHERLKSWGMNSAGNWSEKEFCKMGRTPYFMPIHFSSRRGNALKNEDLLREALELRMAKEETINDPWCVGYFVQNELNWKDVMDPEIYYRTVSEVMKQTAPNKLYLGSRLHSHYSALGAPKEVAAAAAKYCDVVGINRYRFSPSDLEIADGHDKPIIIGEFHFGALDRGTFHPGLRGVGDQNQRARAYVHFLEEALKHPNIVGAHWFQYREQVVTGRKDGENYQIGFIDITDSPSEELVEAARTIGGRMYQIRMNRGE